MREISDMKALLPVAFCATGAWMQWGMGAGLLAIGCCMMAAALVEALVDAIVGSADEPDPDGDDGDELDPPKSGEEELRILKPHEVDPPDKNREEWRS